MEQDIVDAAVLAGSSLIDLSILSLVVRADVIVKIVLVILVAASIWCWAIIFDKIRKFRHVKARAAQFEDSFWSGSSLEDLYDRVGKGADHPMAMLFAAAMKEWRRSGTKGAMRERLNAGLRDVAALIHGRLGTRVFSVKMGGFDTHAGQRGSHDSLMESLDTGLGAFLDDLGQSPAGRETLVLVFSEFGRRVKENGSKGTDHGKAGPMFVMGPAVKGGLFGKHPSLRDLDDGDLAATTDFRSVYGTIIEQWFRTPHEAVLGKRYPLLPLLG